MGKNIVPLKDYIKEYSVRNKKDENIPVYSVTNDLGFCTDYFSKEVASKDKTTYKIVPKGCFAYNPSRINVGSVDWQRVEDRVIVSPLYVVFSVSPLLDQQYLLYYLKSEITLNYIKAYATGSVRDNLKFATLQEFPINLCSLEEQKQIVSKLDFVESLIISRREQLAKLDELVKSRFVELFGTPLSNEKGWEIKSTGDVCSITDGSHFSPVGKEDGYPMLSVRNMRNDGFRYDDCKLVSQEDYDVLVKQGCKPLKNDVLIAKDGSYFYYGFVVKKEIEQAVLSSIAILRPNLEKIHPEYLCRYMLSSEIVDLVGKNYVTGAAIKRVILKGIKQIPIMLPPMALQNQFATFVKQTDKSKLAIQESLAELETLKKALMQKYFG